MKTHVLKAAVLASAATLMASQANAADLTIWNVSQYAQIGNGPTSLSLYGDSSNLAGATIPLSGSGFSGTFAASLGDAGTSGVFNPTFNYTIPVTANGNVDALARALSQVWFTANTNHRLAGLFPSAGGSAIDGDSPGTFLARADSAVVSQLRNITTNTVVFNVSHGNEAAKASLRANLLSGPDVDIDYFAATAADAIILQQGHSYVLNIGVTGISKFNIPNSYAGGINSLSGGGEYLTSFAVTAVPEPETYALMLAGLGLVGFMAKRRKAQ